LATAYTPGLTVSLRQTVRKERLLPLEGEVVVEVGASVRAGDVVARTALPGDVRGVNVVNQLGILPAEIEQYMLKVVGDPVKKGEPIARSRSLFGLLKNDVPSPIDGSIERISKVTGQVLLRTPPKPVEMFAFIDGVVKEVFPKEGVLVEVRASYVQGIFGVGRETWGELVSVASGPDQELRAEDLSEAHRGKLVVGGSLVTYGAIERARALGVKGIIAGGLRDEDLKRLLGYDLGVAITGHEDIGITVVVTEGFGSIAMARRTFDLFRSREGDRASLSAATQIRAGVMRPEIVIPHPASEAAASDDGDGSDGGGLLEPGCPIRCIRAPYFGRIGTVSGLPVELTQVESETWVRVLEVAFADGVRAVVPRANVEIIGGADGA